MSTTVVCAVHALLSVVTDREGSTTVGAWPGSRIQSKSVAKQSKAENNCWSYFGDFLSEGESSSRAIELVEAPRNYARQSSCG